MKKLVSAILLVLIFQLPSQLLAKDVKMEEVKAFINKVGGEIIKSANNTESSPEERKAKIISVIDNAIDSQWISRFVLGKNYRMASDEQKATFMNLYRDFMINTYGPKFQNYNGEKFEVTDVTEQGRFYMAKAEFLPKDSKTPILVAFRVKENGGQLVILDFIAEGISLIETQRSEFNSAISRDGIDKFLQDLKVRTDNLKNS